MFIGGLSATGAGAAASVPQPPAALAAALPSATGDALQPVYLDAHLLVLDKPAGLLCVPGRGPDKQDCLSARVQATWPDARVVHRLDMATSGLCLFARGEAMQRHLSGLFAARAVHKRYVALVDGHLKQGASDADGWSRIDLPLAADWPRRPLQKVDLQSGKPCLTRWRVIAHEADRTRVELEPVTGRSHQLRVHLLALGHAILGDTLYACAEVQARMPRLALHATEMRLQHPCSGTSVHWFSPVPF